MTMNRSSKWLGAAFAVFIIAAGVAVYLINLHYALINGQAGFKSFCSISKAIDCDAVNTSRFSELFGIPLASFALSYYLLAAILCLVGIKNVYWRRESVLTLLGLSAVSVLVSITTFSITFFVLKTLCLLCLALQTLNVISFLFVLAASRGLGSFKQAQIKRVFAMLGVGVLLLGVTQLFASQLKHTLPFNKAAFVTQIMNEPVHNIEVGNSPHEGFKGTHPPLQLIEFADFQCPFCGMAARLMFQLIKLYGNRVQLVFKFFPLDPTCNPDIHHPMHPYGCPAAKAAYCAKLQGEFFPYYEKLFGHQEQISFEMIRKWARELHLNMNEFKSCIASADTTAAIQRDIDQATKLGIESTPTFFANGRRVEGAIDQQRLRVLLDKLATK